jgi:hypothetical protein
LESKSKILTEIYGMQTELDRNEGDELQKLPPGSNTLMEIVKEIDVLFRTYQTIVTASLQKLCGILFSLSIHLNMFITTLKLALPLVFVLMMFIRTLRCCLFLFWVV